MQRTISLKIDLPAEFTDYLAVCAIILNRYVAWSFETKSYDLKSRKPTALAVG
jgi:hypothetical protein